MKIQLSDTSINYNLISPKSVKDEKTVLVFLHEALGSIGQWKNFPKELCDRIGLKGIVYERQGHGESSPLSEERKADYLHNYAFEELHPLLAELTDANNKIILLGHSDGGTIALLYAHMYPTKIAAVITMAAHVINEPETIAGISPAIKAFEASKLNGLNKFHGNKTKDLFYAWANIWRNDAFKHWDITGEIGSDCLYLCIQGKDDQYGTVKQLNLLRENTDAEIHLLDECGHHPHLERKEACLDLISTFISLKVKA